MALGAGRSWARGQDSRILELATIAAAEYAREVLPESAPLWAGNRSSEEYVGDFLRLTESGYGKKRFRTVGLRIDGALVASLKRYERDLACGERMLRAIGIGAVFTPPHLRGRGYASAMLGALLDRERDAGIDLAFLFSDIHPAFYERLGFAALPSRIISIRADSLAVRRMPVSTLRDGDWGAIARCFESVETERAFGLRRTPLVWDYLRLRASSREHGDGGVRLGIRNGRSLIAYVIGRREVEADAFVIDELAYSGESGRDAISTLLRSAAGDLRRISGWLPPAPVRAALPRGAVRRRRNAIAMLVPLSATMRASWLTQREAIVASASDAYWNGDHV